MPNFYKKNIYPDISTQRQYTVNQEYVTISSKYLLVLHVINCINYARSVNILV